MRGAVLMVERASALPLSAVLSAIPSYPRPVIERLVARLIDRLDEADGDPDLEPDDDAEAIDEREPEEDTDASEYGTDQSPERHWHLIS